MKYLVSMGNETYCTSLIYKWDFLWNFYVCLQCGLINFLSKKFPVKPLAKCSSRVSKDVVLTKFLSSVFPFFLPLWKVNICFGIEKNPQICFSFGHHCLTYNIYFHLNLLKLPLLYVKYICQWIKNLLLWNCVFFPDHANLSVFFKGPPPDNIFKIFCFAQIGRRGEKQGVKVEESTRVSKV